MCVRPPAVDSMLCAEERTTRPHASADPDFLATLPTLALGASLYPRTSARPTAIVQTIEYADRHLKESKTALMCARPSAVAPMLCALPLIIRLSVSAQMVSLEIPTADAKLITVATTETAQTVESVN